MVARIIKMMTFLSPKVERLHPSRLISYANIKIRTTKLIKGTIIKKATLYARTIEVSFGIERNFKSHLPIALKI